MPLYRLLLRLYPRWFRARYERELVEAFTTERTRHAGMRGSLRFWVFIASDVVGSSISVRRQPARAARVVHPRRGVMESVLHDLQHACRLLLRRPGFAAVAVLSLAIGIGGNALIFALVDGFVLNPFPYPQSERVVGIGVTFPHVSSDESFVEALSPAEIADISRSRLIGEIAAFDLGNRNISGGDRPERVFTGLALTDPFGPFGLRPLHGRGFTKEELAPNGPPVAILSYRVWQGRFGGDPSLVGRTIRVNGRPTTVVGLMPADLLILGADLWIPWGGEPLEVPRNARQFTVIGRLAPGATLEEANAELGTVASGVAAAHRSEFTEYDGWQLSATPWAVAMMRDARPAGFLLLGAVGLVLLIACANLSNLLLARSTSRHREVAVRLALGARRSRIARELLSEIAVLAAAGAALGLLLADIGLRAALRAVPLRLESFGLTASLNGRVLAWAAVFTIGSAALVALVPMLHSTKTDPQEALKADGRGLTGGRGPRAFRHALIVAEIALSVMLLLGAGLLMRSFANMRQVEPGFDVRNVLTMRLTVPSEKYRGAAINTFFEQLIARMEQVPGVRAVSVASQFPPAGPFTAPFRIDGVEAPGATLPTAMATAASAAHFTTLGVPLVSGRGFTSADRANAPPVVVVNQSFAARFLPGASAIGRRLTLGPPDRPSPPMEIVGVVADTRNQGVRVPTSPEVFVPLPQQTLNNQLFLLVRTDGDATAMLPAVRQQVAAIDPEQPIYNVSTLEDAFAAAAFTQRVSMILLAVFAAVAVTLAAIGIYGVMSYAVTARTQEIGVRMAVGAARGDVLWLVLGQVVRLTALGLVIGIALVLAAGGLLRRLLFEVRPSDSMTIAAVAVVLGSIALFAAWVPAWRASRVDPVEALRYE